MDNVIIATGITVFSGMIGTVLGFAFKSNDKMKALELRTSTLEKNDERLEHRVDQMAEKQDQKFDKLLAMVTEMRDQFSDMRVKLESKADR